MQLWEQGKFQLDDSINKYLKAYQVKHRDPNAPPVTFRHLLTHTSGIGEVRKFTDLLLPVWGLGGKPDKPIPSLKEYYSEGITPEVYPETKWSYANHGFATLGQLVEDISGQPFSEYAIAHIFAPLGMTHTDYLRTRSRAEPTCTRIRIQG
ncbi:MAG: serine hydrolase domain-containing protein [Heteroscytonema crispum UTEX LB 1556]